MQFPIRVNAYSALWLFCILRTVLTVYPNLNADLEPSLIKIYFPDSCFKLNDIVVLVIWVLVSVICAKSILGQYGVLKLRSFREIFYNAFFHEGFQVAGISSSLFIFVLTAVSVGYVYQMVHFIYEQWSAELSPVFQTLQMYPALLMGFQTLCQGSYLLKCLTNPDLKQDVSFLEHHQKSKQQLMDHIWLNFTFILHSVCIFVVIRLCTLEPKIVLEMVTGEVVYRVIAACMFWRVLKQVERMGVTNSSSSNEQSDKQGVMLATVCCEEETGQEGRIEMIVNGRVVRK